MSGVTKRYWRECLRRRHGEDMTQRDSTFLLASIAILLGVGCSTSHGAGTPSDDDPPRVHAVGPAAGAGADRALASPTPLEACLLEGGSLVEVDAVDNNDSADHGALAALAVSHDGRIAAAGWDGTIKFWTLDDGLLGTVNAAILTYGPEVTGAQSSDLVFYGDRVVAGDVRGLVTGWTMEGAMQILGGTEPDVPITAVDVAADGRLAHADSKENGNVMVRVANTGDTWGPLDTSLVAVNDLRFLPDGRLLLGGALDGERTAFELRAADDPMRTVAASLPEGGAPVREVATSAGGGTLAGVGDGFVAVFDDELSDARLQLVDGLSEPSVDVTPNGLVVLTSGADGAIRAFTRDDEDALRELAPAIVAAPTVLRVDAAGELVFVGSADGMISVLACTPAG